MPLHAHLSGLLAVATDDFSICIIDVELRRVVRAFASYFSQVTDMVCIFLFLSLVTSCFFLPSFGSASLSHHLIANICVFFNTCAPDCTVEIYTTDKYSTVISKKLLAYAVKLVDSLPFL